MTMRSNQSIITSLYFRIPPYFNISQTFKITIYLCFTCWFGCKHNVWPHSIGLTLLTVLQPCSVCHNAMCHKTNLRRIQFWRILSRCEKQHFLFASNCALWKRKCLNKQKLNFRNTDVYYWFPVAQAREVYWRQLSWVILTLIAYFQIQILKLFNHHILVHRQNSNIENLSYLVAIRIGLRKN